MISTTKSPFEVAGRRERPAPPNLDAEYREIMRDAAAPAAAGPAAAVHSDPAVQQGQAAAPPTDLEIWARDAREWLRAPDRTAEEIDDNWLAWGRERTALKAAHPKLYAEVRKLAQERCVALANPLEAG